MDLQPADVEIYQNQWLVYEDDEDWAGLVSVSQNSSDALEGLIDLNYQASADKIPSGTGPSGRHHQRCYPDHDL